MRPQLISFILHRPHLCVRASHSLSASCPGDLSSVSVLPNDLETDYHFYHLPSLQSCLNAPPNVIHRVLFLFNKPSPHKFLKGKVHLSQQQC